MFGLLGQDNATLFETLFEQKAIDDRFVRVGGDTRVNMKIVDDTDTTDINMSGPVVGEADVARVERAVADFAGEDTLIVLSGSLPPGCDTILYAEMVAALTARDARVLLDTSGAPLTHALRADVLPKIVKPNRRELAAWADTSLDTMADVVACATALHRRGVALVVVSMGGEGALFVSDEGALVAHLPAGPLASTVGAGDAMVAGLAAGIAEGAGLERIARLSTAFAVAKLGRPGPHLPDLATIDALAAQVTISGAGITGPHRVGEDA